ncbi:hypothetical protein F66182_4848 [Fusarium sp. NRRL 66182]|nr:hypothetical protein F66182_4848 [Fusarium sp. NRRL 66182]
MVKIAVAGGAGNVGQEVIDALVARNKHEILILSRKVRINPLSKPSIFHEANNTQDAPEKEIAPGARWFKTAYDDMEELAEALEGIHTVLSFITIAPGGSNKSQENLIDASIRAGVKRFAPREWVVSDIDNIPWYKYKKDTREYLANINKDNEVIEYTLFHLGMFTNYMTYPFRSSKHITMFETPINFHDRRALVVDDGEAVVTFTTVHDAATVIALAIEWEDKWPLISGIKGVDITLNELVTLGEKIRGGPFTVAKLSSSDLRADIVKAPWLPIPDHPSIPVEIRSKYAADMTKGLLLAFKDGAFQISDEWNRLLPDYKFTAPEEFLSKAWAAIDAGAESVFTEE